MAFNYFKFGEYESLKDCGLYIEKRPARMKPRRDVSAHQIPGRDGDVYIDNGRWESVPQQYQVGCSDIDNNIDKINLMLCQTGMLNLIDTYDDSYYRKAICINSAEFQEDLLNFGHATIEFMCDPYRYLSNVSAQTFTKSITLTNSTGFSSEPLFTIRSEGNSTCTININSVNYTFRMPTTTTQIIIDSETMEAYNSNNNYNRFLQFDNFPILVPGRNTIQITTTGKTLNCSVNPRWRKI